MKKTIVFIVLFYSLGSDAQEGTETAKQEIRKVVASYFNSIDHKDSVTFCNLFVNTIPTISFNYSFWVDNKETNWGIETWQLIYNGKEWKIMSALFSINDPQVTPDTTPKS